MRTIKSRVYKQSFKYSVLISLHYYELNNHPERINEVANKKQHMQIR